MYEQFMDFLPFGDEWMLTKYAYISVLKHPINILSLLSTTRTDKILEKIFKENLLPTGCWELTTSRQEMKPKGLGWLQNAALMVQKVWAWKGIHFHVLAEPLRLLLKREGMVQRREHTERALNVSEVYISEQGKTLGVHGRMVANVD